MRPQRSHMVPVTAPAIAREGATQIARWEARIVIVARTERVSDERYGCKPRRAR